MELTNPINNQDMVDGLNRVLRASAGLHRLCEDLSTRARENAERAELAALQKMHERHIDMLSDSVRFLGGAPARSTAPSILERTSLLFSSPSSLLRRESQLVRICSEEIQRLVGSDEVTQKLNVVSDEVNAQITNLSRALRAG